jgi:hypothetical protein
VHQRSQAGSFEYQQIGAKIMTERRRTPVLIVWFELKDPKKRPALIRKIKSFGPPARLGDSAYLISTTVSAADVRDRLSAGLDVDDGDRLYVGATTRPSAWMGMPDSISNWIHANT